MLTALIGYRTYIFSAIFALCALLIQGHADGVMTLAPMVLMAVKLLFAISGPLAFAFMRKAVEAMKNKY